MLYIHHRYLPGRFYGYLPFELSRFLAFLFFDLAFLVAVIKNRRDLLRLHWAILLVCMYVCVSVPMFLHNKTYLKGQGKKN